ncbi:MAG TPA: ribose-phosphate diphosphokinase [Thermoplasmata archaeon]|nr:ribose-phosphate diphosphokinase [Thermoplasmata archaeon]
MMIISGEHSEKLGKKVSELSGIEFVKRTLSRFPDDELYLCLEADVEEEEVLIIENSYPDTGIVNCLLLKNALIENGAAAVSFVVPYMGYARQDRRFKKGEAVSIKAVLEALANGVKCFTTIDLHKKESLNLLPPSVKRTDLTAVGTLAEYLKKKDVDIIVGPDRGSKERAKMAAKLVGCESDYLEKKRLSGTEVQISPKHLSVKGKSVGIIDDMISTGGTILKASENLFSLGAEKVYACCTHGLFLNNIFNRLRKVCDEVVCTDTLPEREKIGVKVLSVAPLIAEWIEENLV